MAHEIERKFLVRNKNFKKEAFSHIRITQGYLNSSPERTVRVRIKGYKAYLTVKGITSGATRFEWEKEIPVGEAFQLLELAEPGTIDKTRHLIRNVDGIHTWEVDEFHGDNEGLIVAEIELKSESDSFDKPDWIAEEVTYDKRFLNSMLTKDPYKNWK